MATNQPKKYNSLYDFCQGVIAGKCGVKPSVQKLIDDGKFPDAATWAKQLLSEFDLAANSAANVKDPKHPATPQDCSAGTTKKIHWTCSLGHPWAAAVDKRVDGRRCPVCSGNQLLVGFNDLATTHPHLVAEWDYAANTAANAKDAKHPATPQECMYGTLKKLHWKCSSGHTWSASGGNRAQGNGCPICSGRQVLTGFNDMATTHPNLAAEWDYAANAIANSKVPKHPATPQDCIAGTGRKVHWKCSAGHTWSAVGSSRVNGSGCPVCAGKQVLVGFNDLATTHPHLVAEWDYKANAAANAKDAKHPATPQDCAAGTHKKIHWKCSAGHTWSVSGDNRSQGAGCPVCSGRQAWAGFNDLATTHPHLVAEWDYKANAAANAKDAKHPATPQECMAGTYKKIHWKCSYAHIWEVSGRSRAQGAGCPVCAGKQVLVGFNDLATTHPHLVAEWDYKANAAANAKDAKHPATPQECSAGSDKKIHWVCSSGHTWAVAVNSRAGRGTGCPSCSTGRFDPSSPGYLYVIYHSELEAWKVGITNNLVERLRDHKTAGFDTDLAAFTSENNGDFIQTLEGEFKRIIFDLNGAASLRDLGYEQLGSKGYTETWLASCFTPEGVQCGDCPAMLKWLMEELKRLEWADVAA